MRSPARLSVRSSALAVTAVCAGLLGGCAGGAHHHRAPARTSRTQAHVLDVYSSLPLSGPAAAQGRSLVRGIGLALRQSGGRAGPFRIRYRSLSDAARGHGTWDASWAANNARKVAIDPAAVLYIGELASAATEVSLPILNQAGIPQLSPWSPYVGLTRAVPGVIPANEPGRFYPTNTDTFLRLAPDAAVEAGAILLAVHDAGCSRLAVLRSVGTRGYGQELAGLLALEHSRFGIQIVSNAALPAPGVAVRRYLLSLHTATTQCVAYVGLPSTPAAIVLAAIHAELPLAPFVASGELCGAVSARPAERALFAAATGTSLRCMLPAVPPGLAAGARLLSAWRRAYGAGSRPGVWGTYGYTAMELSLKAIAGLGVHVDQRSRLLRALLASRLRDTPLGDVSFDAAGDSSVRAYGLYRVRPLAPPLLVRVLEPSISASGLG